MYCKDCKFNKFKKCESPKICEDYDSDQCNDELTYSYFEGGWFTVGDYFGCIHFKSREDKDSKYE